MIKRTADAIYTYRFIKTLVLDWNKTKAYQLGLIDRNGKRLKSPETPEEKNALTFFHRVVFNVKRIFNLAPGGIIRRISTFAAALRLLKETTNLPEDQIVSILENTYNINLKEYLTEGIDSNLEPGVYTLSVDYPTKHMDLPEGTQIEIFESEQKFLGQQFYRARHLLSNEIIYVNSGIVEEAGGFSVSTVNVADIPRPLKSPSGDRYRKFKIPSPLFNKINSGRNKYQRWDKYLDLTDENQMNIANFCKKYKNATVIIEDEATGCTRALKPNSMGEYNT
jgi:hypothetical protein